MQKNFNIFDPFGLPTYNFSNEKDLIQESFFIASLCLTSLKIAGCSFSVIVNISLLLIITFYAYLNNYYVQLQYLFGIIIKKIMPQHIFITRDTTMDDFIMEFSGYPEFQQEWFDLKNIKWYQKLSFNIFVLLIWLRLWFFVQPLIANLTYTCLIFFLVFNSEKFLTIILIYKRLHYICRNCVSIYLVCRSTSYYRFFLLKSV